MNLHHFRRGEYAIFKAARIEDCARVRIVRAENLPMPDGERARWLHIEFRNGVRVLTHPSHLVPVVD